MNLTFDNAGEACARVDLAQDKPAVDLSTVTFFEPFALIYLGMFLRHYNARGKGFQVSLPTSGAAKKYLSSQNFFAMFNFDPETLDPGLLRRFTASSSLGDLIDIEQRCGIDEEVARQVKTVMAKTSAAVDLALVEEIVAELVSNFARHSQGPLAALAMQWYPRLQRMNLAIGDCGVGIRSSLSSNPRHRDLANKPHYEAAWKAFQGGVSRSHEGGFGLSTVLQDVEDLGGTLVLATGNGYARKYLRGPFRYGRTAFDLPGVQIEVRIPTR